MMDMDGAADDLHTRDMWTPRTCQDVRDAYDRLVQSTSCSDDPDCQVLLGHCAVGLGECHHPVNMSVSQRQLDELRTHFTTLSCTGAVCRCGAPPKVLCKAGACALAS
jgi:hypothetical protein